MWAIKMTIISFRRRIKIKQFRKKIPRHRGMKTKSYIPHRIVSVYKGKVSLYKIRKRQVRLFKWKAPDPRIFFRSFNIIPSVRRFTWKKEEEKRKKKPSSFKSSIAKKRPSRSFQRDKSMDELWEKKGWKKMVKKWQDDPTIGPQKRKIYIGYTSGYSKKHKFKWGRDPWGGNRSKFRTYKWLGPAGPQEPALIFDIRPNPQNLAKYIQQFKKSGKSKLGQTMVKNDIEKIIQKAKWYIVEKTGKFVGKYVPKDTGKLRRTMLKSLGDSKVHGFILRMKLGTGDLEYAKPVNRMPTSMVQHHMKAKRKSRGWYDEQGGFQKNRTIHPGFNILGYKNAPRNFIDPIKNDQKYLHDPHAIKGWWGFSVMQARQYAREAYDQLITDLVTYFTVQIYGATGLPIPKVIYQNVQKLQMGLDVVKQLFNYRKMNIEWTWTDQKNIYEKIHEFVEPEPRKWVKDHWESKTDTHLKRQRRATLRKNRSIGYYFPEMIRPLTEGLGKVNWKKEQEQVEEARRERERKMSITQDFLSEAERNQMTKRALLRARISAKEVKKILIPTRLDIKRLFMVKFK